MHQLDHLLSIICHEYTGVITQTKLVKLVYEVDREAASRLNEKVTRVKYVKHHYGPFSRQITDAIENLCDKDILEKTVVNTGVGRAYIYTLNETHKKSICRDHFSENKQKIIEFVCSKYAEMDTKKVVKSALESEPCDQVRKYEPIPLPKKLASPFVT